MTKMTDVAKIAKVSTATVSRVLSNHPNVSPEMREKVLRAIEELDYKPNLLASNLRRMTSRTILVVLPDITNPFFSQVVQGFQTVARERNYHVLLGDTGNDLEQEREFIELVNQKMVDGLILATARISNDEILAVTRELPVVLSCEYLDSVDIPTVSIDNVAASREATQHLISLGHRRIAHISGPLGVVLSRDRIRGYRQALQLNELEVDDSLIQEGDFTLQSGRANMKKILAMAHPPSAVFAANDEMAVGVIKAIKEAGLSVPKDISVIGFDDVPFSTIITPELTTIHQPKFDIGTKAMNLLLDLIEDVPISQKQMVLSHKLIGRESTSQFGSNLVS